MVTPFLLRPSGKDYIWGGQRLNREFCKNIDMNPLAETWECSTHPDGPCYVDSGEFFGASLAEVLQKKPELLGSRHMGDGELPILVKLIDAKKDLSVQVHPTDEYAQKYENGQMGKSEMWYVLDAKRDARLVYGLKQDAAPEELRQAIDRGRLGPYLQSVQVRRDEVFFIEAGTIHAIGAGCLVAEIQENSNLTYRLYDYDRIGKDGRCRELHIDKALDVAKLKSSVMPHQPVRPVEYRDGIVRERLCQSKYFQVWRMFFDAGRGQSVAYRKMDETFRVLLCVWGSGSLEWAGGSLSFGPGRCIFVPAGTEEMRLAGKARLLEIVG